MYSLREIVGAVQQRDRYKFERYVDVDTLIQSFVAEYSQDNPLAMAIATTMTSSLKQQVTKAIEDGTVSTDSQLGYGLSTFMSGTAEQRIERQGPNAYFFVPTKTKGGSPFKLRFHLTQVPDGYWRVDRATNFKDLLAAEAVEEAGRKALLEKALAERLSKLEVVAKLHTSITDGWNRTNRFQLRLKNNSDKPITGMTGKIMSAATGFDQGIRGDVRLAPGETQNGVWEFRVNQFIPETERMYALNETERFDVEIESIAFADGSNLKRGEIE